MHIFFNCLDIKGVNELGFNQIVNTNFIAVENQHRKTFIASRSKTEMIKFYLRNFSIILILETFPTPLKQNNTARLSGISYNEKERTEEQNASRA